MVSEKKIFGYFFENLPFISPCQPIKLRDLYKSRMKCGGLLNKHFCKQNSNISNASAEIVNFHFFHYKSMETISCHSNQSSYPTGIKNVTSFPLSVDANYVQYGKNRTHSFRGDVFKNVDGRTIDRRRMPVYTMSSPMSRRLR